MQRKLLILLYAIELSVRQTPNSVSQTSIGNFVCTFLECWMLFIAFSRGSICNVHLSLCCIWVSTGITAPSSSVVHLILSTEIELLT